MRCGPVRVGTLFVVMANAAALAQLPTATILGTVTDSSGAIVPGAPLTARHLDTGQIRTATSAQNGSYRFAALPIGDYEVRVEVQGFQTSVHGGLKLAVLKNRAGRIAEQTA